MALVHRGRQLPDWPGFVLPERWRRLFDIDPEHEECLRVEEYRDREALVLRTEVPGIDPEKDVEITVGDGVLEMRIPVPREQEPEMRSIPVTRR
jgi:HSP20 family protein